ncbi:hypothetical protein ACJD0Z_00310 [Flavobacteriaceae bacterium M23B6Z8]
MIKNLRAVNIHYQLLLFLAVLIPSRFYKLGGIVVALLAISWVFKVQGYRQLKQIEVSILLGLLSFVFFYILLTTNRSSHKYLPNE